ncbi:MFS transporter [Streptomyces sp. NPDC058231]|uniref:MFS transporter n=1 Tax=Streptomyces sp. NPDC058231 TaxID=3346392 RepID=UPI0036ED3FB5
MSLARTPISTAPRRIPARTRCLIGISLGYFMVLLDMTVLSVAEPDLASSLHTSVAGLQWATTGYTVAFAALLLSAGAVADRYGAHRVLRSGITVFTLVSLLSAAAPDLKSLVALRVVLGMAAAACVPASLAVIARLYPQPAERARALSVWAAISGAAVAAGPIAGGALVDAAGWRSIFLVNVPIGLAVLALTAGRTMVCPRGESRISWLSQLAAAVVLALFTDAVVAAGARGWIHTLCSSAAAALSVIVFVALERRSPVPVLNRALLREDRVRAGLLAGAAVNFALTGGLFVLPLVLQQRYGFGPLETGLAFLPLTLPFAVNPPFTGRMVARVGPRRPVLGGLALLAAGGVVLAAAVHAAGGYPFIAAGLLMTGLGVSYALPALVAAVVGAAPEGTAGSVGGLLNAVRQAGATLGVAVMGAVITYGADRALLASAAACATALVVFARTGGRGTRGRQDPDKRL